MSTDAGVLRPPNQVTIGALVLIFGFFAAELLGELAGRYRVGPQFDELIDRFRSARGPSWLYPQVQVIKASAELLLDSRTDGITNMPRSERQQLQADIVANLTARRNEVSAYTPLAPFVSVAQGAAWLQAVTRSDADAGGPLTDTQDAWVRTHYYSQLELLSKGSMLDGWGAGIPVPTPVLTLPEFESIDQLDFWKAGWEAKLESGTISNTQWEQVQVHYRAEKTRLQEIIDAGGGIDIPTDIPSDIIIPETGDLTDAVAGQAAGLSLLTGLGIGVGGLTVAGTRLFQQMGNAQSKGRLGCFQSSFAATAGNILRVVAPLALPIAAFKTDIGKSFVDKIGGQFFDLILEGANLTEPANIDTVRSDAARLLTQKMGLGISAHAWSAAMEAASPLKTLGLNQLAAQLADMAGFGRLASITLGAVETASIGEPMRQDANRRFQSKNPPLFDVATAYAKKELPPGPIPQGFPPRAGFTEADPDEPWANFYEVMRREGFPDWWIRTASHHMYQDPRTFELIRIGQFYNPELDERSSGSTEFMKEWIDARPWLLPQIGISRAEWDEDPWFYFKASVSGYEPSDTRVIVETIKRAVLRREQTLFLDATTRLYRDGYIGDDELHSLTVEAWGAKPEADGTYNFRGDPIRARVRATELRTDYQVRKDVQQLYLRAMKVGVVAEDQVRTTLAEIGMPVDRINLEILRTKLGLLPGVRLAIDVDGPIGNEGDTADEDVFA